MNMTHTPFLVPLGGYGAVLLFSWKLYQVLGSPDGFFPK